MATKKEVLAQQVARAVGAGKIVALETVDFNDPNRPKTYLEVDFPILPVNQVAIIEGNAGKPIYQMSKWWARRRSSVFRSMLIAAATKAPDDPSHAAKLVWDNCYANHQKKGAFKNLRVADIFMGGGTTEIIYACWAKHGPCQVTGCGHRTPILNSPLIAVKKISVKYWGHRCGKCGVEFHVEEGAARMAPDVPLYVNPSEYLLSVLDRNRGACAPNAGILRSSTSARVRTKRSRSICSCIRNGSLIARKWMPMVSRSEGRPRTMQLLLRGGIKSEHPRFASEDYS